MSQITSRLVFGILVLVILFLPTGIACSKNLESRHFIFTLNLFLGGNIIYSFCKLAKDDLTGDFLLKWIVIPWVILLVLTFIIKEK